MELLAGDKKSVKDLVEGYVQEYVDGYDPKDIANAFKVSHATVLRWIDKGSLHAKMIEGRYKVPETSLKMFIENFRST